MIYTSELIDCNVNDKVYVYNNRNDQFVVINKDLIGVVESIKQAIEEDWLGISYLSYLINIRMKNGELIKIKDDEAQPIRKYEFITIKDLKKDFNIDIDEEQGNMVTRRGLLPLRKEHHYGTINSSAKCR